jgi:hypothetical protein
MGVGVVPWVAGMPGELHESKAMPTIVTMRNFRTEIFLRGPWKISQRSYQKVTKRAGQKASRLNVHVGKKMLKGLWRLSHVQASENRGRTRRPFKCRVT